MENFKEELLNNLIPTIKEIKEKERKHLAHLTLNGAPNDFLDISMKYFRYYTQRIEEYKQYAKNCLLIVLSFGLLSSCSNDEEKTQRKKSIFVLGNSITHSPQGGEWGGNWGMAATSPDRDFCGILSRDYDLDRKNIAIWENNFYCEEQYYKILPNKHYDYIIIKIGENVGDVQNFKVELQKLTDYYKNLGTDLILVTTVWKQYAFDVNGNPFEVPSDKDRIIKEVANEDGFILVDISAMTNFPSFYAWGEYTDSAIASHPSDLGMVYIANKIKEKL